MKKVCLALIWALSAFFSCNDQARSANGQFVGDVVAKWMPNGREMQLTDSFGYIDTRGNHWTVPTGATVDGASIPRPLWSIVGTPFSGKYRKASVVHDYFCQQMSQPWKKVHEVFFEASLAEGNSLYHSRLMYGAVYAWGPRWDIVNGKPIRTRDPAKPPTEHELHDLAEWIKVGDRSLEEISRFVDNRFSRAGPAPEKRVALVIGNSGYAHTRSLPNARHDAYAMAGFLKALGFQVTARHDASYEVLRTVVRDFGSTSAGADFAVLYYAGHGLEVTGENYLLPVDAKLATSSDLEYEAIALTSVLDVVRARRKLNLLILDTCRNNPLAEKMALRDGAKRSVQKGLARVEPKGDILIAFAANAGTVAQDGTGLNSPFVEALIGHLGKPGLDIRLALGGVRDAVMAATGNMQEPVIYGALGGQIISLAPPVQNASAAQPNAVLREQEAKAAWDAVKDGCSAADIKLFAGRYKDTFFGDLAARRLGEIDQRSICVERGEVAMDEALFRSVQSELKRLGCFDGPVNGNWGSQSSAGFKLYVQHAKLPQDLTVPNGDLLAGMLRAKGRVCPLACKSDEKVAGGKCIKTPRSDPTVNTAVTAPPLAKPNPVPKLVAGDCGSVRKACMQLRSQCIRVCREKLEGQAYGSCNNCISSFSTCVSQGSSGACQ